MPPERREIKVPIEKIPEAIDKGKANGWKYIKQKQQGSTVILTFERQTEEDPFADESPNIRSSATKQPFYRRSSCWILSGLIIFTCCGFCVFVQVFGPSQEELNATRTVEAQTEIDKATNDTIKEATEVAAQNATATIIALTPTATFTRTPTMTNTPLPSDTPTPLPPSETPYYEPAADAQGRVPGNFQAMMTAIDTNLRALEGVENVSQHTIMYDGLRPDGYFAGFKIEAGRGKNGDEKFVTEVRQVIRNVLFNFYGSYPYLGVALTIDDGDELLWTWGSDEEIWVAQNTSNGDTVFIIGPTPNNPSPNNNIQSSGQQNQQPTQVPPTNIPPRPTQRPQPTQPPQQPIQSSGARPGNCSTAVAMGLSAQDAAQWNHLDRDNDGVACYGD